MADNRKCAKKPDHHDFGKKKFEGPTAPVEP